MGNKASNHEESILESHTHDSHHAALKAMCRICGFRPQTQSQARNHNSRTRKVTQSSSQIKACFDIDVALDIQTIHPPTLCESCYKTARRKNHDLELYRPIKDHALIMNKFWRSNAFNASVDSCDLCLMHMRNADLTFASVRKENNSNLLMKLDTSPSMSSQLVVNKILC